MIHTREVFFPHQTNNQQNMARLQAIVKKMKSTKVEPLKRPRSAPLPKQTIDPLETESVPQRKRARSEAATSQEPSRISKRLRGIAADAIVLKVEEVDETVLLTDGGGSAAGKQNRKREFLRTLSSNTTTTVEDEESNGLSTPKSLTATPSSSPPETRGSVSSTETTALSTAALESSRPGSSQDTPEDTLQGNMQPIQPLFRNTVPATAFIDGHPSLRVCFRKFCVYRVRAAIPAYEWRSHHLFQHITDSVVLETFKTILSEKGYIEIPDTLFGEISEEDEEPIWNLITVFLERYALPHQPIPSFAEFIHPVTKLLQVRWISWWKTLAEYFCVPNFLSKVYNCGPGEWHMVFHGLPTFFSMREFSEVAESLGFKRARETIHQELARRVAFVKGNKKIKVETYYELLKLGYSEMREVSKRYDSIDKYEANVRSIMENCAMCCVTPGFSDQFSE